MVEVPNERAITHAVLISDGNSGSDHLARLGSSSSQATLDKTTSGFYYNIIYHNICDWWLVCALIFT